MLKDMFSDIETLIYELSDVDDCIPDIESLNKVGWVQNGTVHYKITHDFKVHVSSHGKYYHLHIGSMIPYRTIWEVHLPKHTFRNIYHACQYVDTKIVEFNELIKVMQ